MEMESERGKDDGNESEHSSTMSLPCDGSGVAWAAVVFRTFII